MSGITTTGFEPATVSEITDDIASDQRALVSPTIDTTAASTNGKNNAIFAQRLRSVWLLAEAIYTAAFTDNATGYPLALRAAMTGTQKRLATRTRVTAQCTLAEGTYPAGSLVASIEDLPTSRFASIEDVVSEGDPDVPGDPAIVDVIMDCETTGAVRADAGTLIVIAQAVSGWTEVTNAEDGALGRAEETDAALRTRRVTELAAQGSTTLVAVRSDILRDVEGTVSCKILENDTGDTDANGVPGHSLECIVYGPASPTDDDDQAVAEQIWASKGSGVGTYGSTSRTVLTSQGDTRTVSFTRPTPLEVYVEVELEVDADTYEGDTAVKVAMATLVSELGAGVPLRWTRLQSVPYSIAGVTSVVSFGMSTNALGPFVSADIVPTVRQIASLDTDNVAVTS
jgi:uncharacterized phage protein gp47/JayE